MTGPPVSSPVTPGPSASTTPVPSTPRRACGGETGTLVRIWKDEQLHAEFTRGLLLEAGGLASSLVVSASWSDR
jgi:hypothetical protein